MQSNHITYVLEANGVEIFEATSLKEAIRKARAKADELQADVSVFETDEETGDQAIVVVVHPAKGVQP